jgi:hypothetical protein
MTMTAAPSATCAGEESLQAQLTAAKQEGRKEGLQEAARFALSEGARIRDHWAAFFNAHPGDDFAAASSSRAQEACAALEKFADQLDALALQSGGSRGGT